MLGLPVLSALLPLLLCVALLVDLARWAARRRPFMAVRLTTFLWVYLAAEAAGLVALFGVWIVSCFGLRGNALLDLTWRFQQLWTAWLFGAANGVFGLRLKIEGDEHVEPGPLIVLVRHASIVDNLLPSVLIARRHQIRVRYVLKRKLLGDPCIDVAAKRLTTSCAATPASRPSATTCAASPRVSARATPCCSTPRGHASRRSDARVRSRESRRTTHSWRSALRRSNGCCRRVPAEFSPCWKARPEPTC